MVNTLYVRVLGKYKALGGEKAYEKAIKGEEENENLHALQELRTVLAKMHVNMSSADIIESIYAFHKKPEKDDASS